MWTVVTNYYSFGKGPFLRVREESHEVSLTRQALFLEALCNLAVGDSQAVLELLEGKTEPAFQIPFLLVLDSARLNWELTQVLGVT